MARIDSNFRFLRATALSLCFLAASIASVSAQSASKQQLDAAMVNKVEFKSAPLADAVESIRQATGVNVLVRLPAQSQASAPAPRVTLTMTHIPLLEALKYIASEVNMKVKIEPYAVVLVPMTEDTDPMVTATFRDPTNFIPNSTGTSGTSPNPLDQPAAPAQ
jgi:general secretion pathway protein D